MYNLIKVDINDISKKNTDIRVFNHEVFSDARGSISIRFEGIMPQSTENFISFKESISRKMTARGFHYQKDPYSQSKIIFVEKGEILDFFFDTNDENKKIYCLRIEEKMNKSLLIPKNYAHGFIALKKTKFKYLCIGEYSEKHEETFNILPSIAKIMNLKNLILSEKDSSYPLLDIKNIYNS